MKSYTIRLFFFLGILTILPAIHAMENNEFNRVKTNLSSALNTDVISPATWKDITQDIKKVEQKGTPVQQAAIETILNANKPIIEKTIENTFIATVNNTEVKKFIGAIAMGTVYGALPSIGFKALSILSGNLDLATAGLELVDVGILSALDSFVRYAEQKAGSSQEMTALQAGMVSTAVQQFIGFKGTRPTDIPLLGPAGRPLMAGLQGLAFTVLTKKFEAIGGADSLLQKVNWRDIVQGSENQQAITQHSGAYEFIKNNLSMIVQNQTVRSAVATTVTYAVEGAVLGAVMHSLGLGFYDDTLTTALANSMMRGAMEGLYVFSQYGERHLGAIQRLQGGFTSMTVQRYMQSGVGMGALDITPVVVQQVTSSAVTSIVRQAGGWANTFKSLYSTSKKALWG